MSRSVRQSKGQEQKAALAQMAHAPTYEVSQKNSLEVADHWDTMTEHGLRWFRHGINEGEEDMARTVLGLEVEGRRGRG